MYKRQFLTITNSFKLFDQNLSLTGGEPMHQTEMMALNIYDTFYGRVGYEGVGQAKAEMCIRDRFMYGFAANQNLLQHYVEVFNGEIIAMLHPYHCLLYTSRCV